MLAISISGEERGLACHAAWPWKPPQQLHRRSRSSSLWRAKSFSRRTVHASGCVPLGNGLVVGLVTGINNKLTSVDTRWNVFELNSATESLTACARHAAPAVTLAARREAQAAARQKNLDTE